MMILPLSAYFVIQNSKIQTYLTQYVAKRISKQLNAKISIGQVNFTFFNQLLLRNVYIEDQTGDTLLYANRVNLGIKSLNRTTRQIVFNRAILREAAINLKQDSSGISNLKFIIDELKAPEPAEEKWRVSFGKIEIQNSKFSFLDAYSVAQDTGANFKDIDITNLDLVINQLRFDGDTTFFNLSHISFREKSGFELVHLSSETSLSSQHIKLNELQIETSNSNLDFGHLRFNYNDFSSFKDFINSVTINAHFHQSDLHMNDLAYFAPRLSGFYENISLRGTIRGRVSNFKGENFEIRIGPETYFTADINLIGLPKFEKTFIFLDLLNFTTTVADLENIRIPGASQARITLPEQFKHAGRLTYEGKFTGFIDDFVAYGRLTSDLGEISTDLLIRPDKDNRLQFQGMVQTMDFNIGKLLDNQDLGNITLNAQVNGNFNERTGIEAILEGTIQSIDFLNYNYRQITLSGGLSERKFDGALSIADPNVNFQFLGRVDFSTKIPQFDFSAQASNAQLYKLNIDKSDPLNSATFLVTANFTGNNLDNAEGNIKILEFNYLKNGITLKVEDLSLTALTKENEREISLKSNFLDAEINGNFEFATLGYSMSNLISKIIPALSENNSMAYLANNNFDFIFRFKDTKQITEIFFPWLEISKNSYLSGRYYPENFDISLNGNFDTLKLANNSFDEITIQSTTVDSVFKIHSKSKQAVLLNGFHLHNLAINSVAENNNIGIELNWSNTGSVKNQGDFIASVNIEKQDNSNIPLINVLISPSKITLADLVWQISQSTFLIDSTAITIGDFMFSNQSQFLKLYGKLSEDPSDELNLQLNNINLDQFDLLSKTKKFAISGIAHGNAKISGVYNRPMLNSEFSVENLIVNSESLGNMNVESSWNYDAKAINLTAFTEKDADRLFNLSGSFTPHNEKLNFHLSLNKFNTRVFNGLLDQVFTDIRGIASGNASLSGTLKNPIVNGNISLQKASLLFPFLNTRYSFTHTVELRNNNIIFNNLKLNDPGNNQAILNGSINSNHFRDFYLDLSINARDFLSLNTNEGFRQPFYGRVFSTGIIKITGPAQNITMDISARTERNTRFFIPLQTGGEVNEVTFLTFAGKPGTTAISQPTSEINVSGIQLNFDLEITPDAEIQIIFDSKIGDIIRGRGSGNINLEINTLGSFNMFGEYIIEQGDYLFTLQNVINKKLEIERGGRIVWNGSPYDANVDLLAIYRVRAPLNELFLDNSEQYTRRVPIECQIQMNGRLMAPDLVFNIDAPTADSETRRKLQRALNTEEKINRQFLSLLVINNFLPEMDLFTGLETGNTIGMGATTAGVTTATEFFSNQLSNWLSQMSNDFDIGINYRPGDEVSPEELEVALSTQVFNDRVSINGNVDMTGSQTHASNIVGDFDVDIRLNRSGKIRLKAFTRANDQLRYQVSPYTQGIGLFYKEEFDSFSELLRQYWRFVTFQNNSREEEGTQVIIGDTIP